MGFDEPFFQRSDTQMVQESLDWHQPALAGITLLLQAKGYARLKVGTPESYATR